MQMMPCPHCGARNSVKRTSCYQCEKPLHAGPPQPPPPPGKGSATITTCGDCAYASTAPPLGRQMGRGEVWCSKREEPVSATQAANECYEPAFTWSREEIID